jgi:hypothetical protein
LFRSRQAAADDEVVDPALAHLGPGVVESGEFVEAALGGVDRREAVTIERRPMCNSAAPLRPRVRPCFRTCFRNTRHAARYRAAD